MELSFTRLAGRLGYTFKDPDLFRQALTHRSAAPLNNERLEFLGDAVLSVVITQWLFERFPEASEGELTRIRSSLVKGTTLAKIARELELGECLQLGSGEKKSGGHRRESILADAVEAIIGAIFYESGLDACRDRILHWYHSRLETHTLFENEKDAKTRLQELMQSRGLPLPQYDVLHTEGDPHNQTFTVTCSVTALGEPVRAKASSRKKAEKKAAEQALNLLTESSSE